jgi:hypothetical protein
MIEAVENHMPEVIVIDEIGTELEAQAARTIAERGVQLVGTAHGNTLDNLMMNPTLSDLVGGIQSVTLGDEEAKRRGTQKSVLERRAPPTFDIVVEIQDRDRVAIQPDVSEAVDAALRGQPLATEIRWLDENGEVKIEKVSPVATPQKITKEKRLTGEKSNTHRLFLFGVNRGRFQQVVEENGLTVNIVDKLGDADLLVTSKSHYRRKPQKLREAEAANIPVYVLRSNTPAQIKQFLHTIYPSVKLTADNGKQDLLSEALSEAQDAVNMVKDGQSEVELSPQSAYIRRLQHLVAERSGLSSQSSGQDPRRRVKIFK